MDDKQIDEMLNGLRTDIKELEECKKKNVLDRAKEALEEEYEELLDFPGNSCLPICPKCCKYIKAEPRYNRHIDPSDNSNNSCSAINSNTTIISGTLLYGNGNGGSYNVPIEYSPNKGQVEHLAWVCTCGYTVRTQTSYC